MLTKQDEAKKILRSISEERFQEVRSELDEIKMFAGHENVILTDEQRAVMTKEAAEQLKGVFETLKLDYLKDPNLLDTPMRLASMWVNELMVGRYSAAPRIEAFPLQIETKSYNGEESVPTLFDGTDDEPIVESVASRMIISKKVDLDSLCSHHFMPFFDTGENSFAIVAYKPSDKLLGISKLQRVVNYFGQRPQLQENLLSQIHEYIKEVIQSDDVMVIGRNIMHTCETARGVKSSVGRTNTTLHSGIFNDVALRQEVIANS